MSRVRDGLVALALALALLTPAYFAAAALATKFGLLDWRFGFGQMTIGWGPLLLLGVGALAVLALILALAVAPRRGARLALLALLIPASGLGYAAYVRQEAMQIPPIHDISTDLEDPPSFSADVQTARARVPGANDLDLASKRTRDGALFVTLQRQAYADIQPISTGLDPARAFDVALALAREQGWRITRTDAAAGVIEATAETFWFGFIDDIAIRVRPDGSGARIDMRSVSRVGQSDLGANAARMRPYLAGLDVQLRQAESGA